MESIVNEVPKSEEKRIIVSSFWLKNNRVDLALPVLEQGVILKPDASILRKRLGEIYVATKEYDKAKKVLLEGITLYKKGDEPERINLQVALAEIALRERDLPRAKELVDEVLKKDPKNVDAQMITGKLNLAGKDWGGAVASFRIVVNDHPELIEGHIALARSHTLNKEYGIAMDVLKDALKKEPDSDPLLKAKAEIHLLREEIDQARTILEGRVKKHPDNPMAIADLEKLKAVLVRYYFSKGKVQEAENLCLENPANSDAWLALGGMYEQAKNYLRAMEIYEQVLNMNPDSYDAANNLAFLLAEAGDASPITMERASGLAQKALTLNPGSPFIEDTLGWIKYKMGDVPGALENIESALKKLPDHPVINYHMGVVYNRLDRKDEAVKVLGKALEVKADFQGKGAAQKLLYEMRN